MNGLQKVFLCLLLISAMTSCKLIMLNLKGVKKPKIETEQTTVTFLNENCKEPFNGLFIARDSLCFLQLISLINGFPSVDFFNSDGKLIKYSTTGDCLGKAEKFAVAITGQSTYPIDSSYHWIDIADKLMNFNGKTDEITRGKDFTIVFYWAKYMGKMNKGIFEIIKAIGANQSIHPKIYLVNMDFQYVWGLKQVPKIIFN